MAIPCAFGFGALLSPLLGTRVAGGADWFAGLALLGLGCVWWRMRFFEVEFSPEGVAFGFGGLHKRVPADRIVSLQPEDYSAARYMGWGYRFGWKSRDRAYSLVGTRTGVRLVFSDARGRTWSVYLATRAPLEALRAARAGASRKKDAFC